MPNHACPCRRPTPPRHSFCGDCNRTRCWARRMTREGGARLRSLERWAEAVARDGRRSWRCACGAGVGVRRTGRQCCSECMALRAWARNLTQGSGRRLRSLERWAERIARHGRRSWRCACGAELPDPINCVHCAGCARVRYWARKWPKLVRLNAKRQFGRESGDWICSACGDFQGPVEHTRCTKCGCDVTTGEPDSATRHALRVTAKVEHLSAGGTVVWNGAHGTPLLEDGPAGSSLAWIVESASGYRVRPEMWS